jgi:S-adenosylmethionine-diacylglycerol 3-amino-3-carboxypropyl transferase
LPSEIEQHALFDRIRYAQCWEDADRLLEALAIRPGAVCLSIASAGDNTLALLACNPARVIALDLSPAQLACLALRVAAVRRLRHRELLELMGSLPSRRREALFDDCLALLSTGEVRFWEARRKAVARHGIGGVGKFEGYFRLFRRWFLPLVHGVHTRGALLADRTPEGRRRFYDRRWNTVRWRGMLRLFFSRPVMGRLGRDPAFFAYARGRLADHLAGRVRHALVVLNPNRNPYLQWIVAGRHLTALPFALRPGNLDRIRRNLDRLEWRRQSVEAFADSGERVDAFNLSDIFEYMSAENFTRLYGRLLDCARPGARLAYWNMMVPRQRPRRFAAAVTSRHEEAARLHERDKAFFYSRFVLEEVR